MGVPASFLSFLELPFWYDPKDFGMPGKNLKEGYYSNGQPMGLYISFPMFELAHYVIAKFAVASTDSKFSICGDDIVFACNTKEEAGEVKYRYCDVIESFGGIINPLKSVETPLIEGVGKLYFCSKGDLIDITPPTGNISPREMELPTYLQSIIKDRTPVGRAIFYSWLSPATEHTYTYKDRSRFWKWLMTSNYHLTVDSYNDMLKNASSMPQEWSWDKDAPVLLRQLEAPNRNHHLKYVSLSALRDAILTTRIKSLISSTKKGPEHGR
jgi:hypothetical protein